MSDHSHQSCLRRTVWIALAISSWLAPSAPAAAFQQAPQTAPVGAGDGQTPPVNTDERRDQPQEPRRDQQDDKDQPPEQPGRLFGVLPNSLTVEANTPFMPVTTRETFQFATEDSFDKYVYPYVAGIAWLGIGQPSESYVKRYATSMADTVVGNFMVEAIVPALVRQDPRYFRLGGGGFWRRASYAATRTVITRSRSGHAQFNISEWGGNGLTAAVSNLYYPHADRTAGNTLARAGSQIVWDAAAFESKEFWPDIRDFLVKTFHRN